MLGMGLALLAESALANSSPPYRTLREVCLFSPTLAPAESPVGLQSLGMKNSIGGLGDDNFVRDFKTKFGGQAGNTFGAIMSAALPVKGLNELLGEDWRYVADDTNEHILGATESGWASLQPSDSEFGTTADSKARFRLSGVPGTGIENNGFVAGFDFKY
jgi:hypothetical protein